MTTVSEAWGFKHGEQVEWRPRPVDPWVRGVIVGFTADKTILVRGQDSTRTRRIGNPRNVRSWKPPTTLDDIERFLDS